MEHKNWMEKQMNLERIEYLEIKNQVLIDRVAFLEKRLAEMQLTLNNQQLRSQAGARKTDKFFRVKVDKSSY